MGRHKWYYFPGMQLDEALVFSGLWSLGGGEGPGNQLLPRIPVPHTSFYLPGVPEGTPGRRSIETRVMAAFPKAKAKL